MNLFAESFGARASALVSFDPAVPKSDIIIATGAFDEPMLARYLRDFAVLDPAPEAFSHLPVGRASSTDRMFSAEELRKSTFHNELFAPAGLVETLGGVTRKDGGRFEMFGLQRGKERDAYEEEDDHAVESIIPHLARVLQLRRLFQSQALLIGRLEHALDRASAGMLVLDNNGRTIFANAAMREIMNAADGLVLDRGGRLLISDAVARRHVEGYIRDIALGGAGGSTTIGRPSGRRSYVLLAAPLPLKVGEELHPGPSGGALITVHDPEADILAPLDLLQRGLNLPRGAAELSLALATGEDLKGFAESRGVTIHTARFHLRTALERTGAGTQAGLVRLVVRLLADLGASVA